MKFSQNLSTHGFVFNTIGLFVSTYPRVGVQHDRPVVLVLLFQQVQMDACVMQRRAPTECVLRVYAYAVLVYGPRACTLVIPHQESGVLWWTGDTRRTSHAQKLADGIFHLREILM